VPKDLEEGTILQDKTQGGVAKLKRAKGEGQWGLRSRKGYITDWADGPGIAVLTRGRGGKYALHQEGDKGNTSHNPGLAQSKRQPTETKGGAM